MRKIRRYFEILLVQFGHAVVPLIPRSGILFMARVFGGAACRFSGKLRKIGETNLDLAFGDTLSDDEKKRILKQSFTSFALTLLDLFWFSRWSVKRLKRWIRMDDNLDEVLAAQPFVFVTGHMGNWEQLGQATSLTGFPLYSIAAPIKNQAVDKLLLKMRKISGQEVVHKQGAIKKLMQVLRDGKNIAVLLDQNTKPSQGGIFVNYFGIPSVSQAPASMAIRTGARILIAHCIHDTSGVYQVKAVKRIDPEDIQDTNPSRRTRKLTQAITTGFEEAVRANPGAWLWTYKRWKFVPPGGNKDDHPFYAKYLRPEDREKAEAFEKKAGAPDS